jgi:hypothetical protein
MSCETNHFADYYILWYVALFVAKLAEQWRIYRDFMLVGPLWGPIKMCFSTPKLRGIWGHAPQEIFEKFALSRAILVHFGQYIMSTTLLANQDKN